MILAAFFLTAQAVLSPFNIEGVSGPTHCGTYQVWEDREKKRGRQINLSIIVLNALGPARQPDPLFFLQGGPGDAPSFNASFYNRVFQSIRQNRDLVLVDLRGTGKSGALTCPELAEPDATGVLDPNQLSLPALRACRARLEKKVDLRLYTTEIAVDDLEHVRQALGYQRINLYGTSYGTRVAQVYMRRHPSSLRTVTLKGIVPPSLASPETHAREGEEAWQRLVQRCQSDENCARSFPTLGSDLPPLLQSLENIPRVLTMPAGKTNPLRTVKVTRGLFAEAFRNFLYSPESSARAPLLLKNWLSGDGGSIAESALNARLLLSGERLAAGFFLSVSCTEDVPYLPKNIAPLVAGTFGGDYRLRHQIAACGVWPKGRVSGQHRQPTRSNIPTLLFQVNSTQ
jgi:pimeloyl-ACP methyl ester carboxylesterase